MSWLTYIRKHEIPEEIKKIALPLDLHYYNPVHEQEAKYLGGCCKLPGQDYNEL